MRVHTRVVIDIATGRVLADDWFDYDGPVASCDPATAIGGAALIGGVLGNDAAGQAADATREAANTSTGESRRQFDLVRSDTAPYRDVGQGSLYRLADIYGISHAAPGALSPQEQQELQQLQAKQNSAPGTTGMMPSPFFRGLMQPTGEVPAPLTDTEAARLRELQTRAAQPQTTTGQFNADAFLKASPGYQFRLSEGLKAIDRNQSNYRFTPRAAKELERYSQGVASDEFGRYLESQFRLAGLGGNAVNTSANAGMTTANQVGTAARFGGEGEANAAIAGAGAINNAVQGGLNNYYTLQAYNNLRPVTPTMPTPPTPFYGVGASPY